jgi:Holliday junction resolvase RusA-like endonuclease
MSDTALIHDPCGMPASLCRCEVEHAAEAVRGSLHDLAARVEPAIDGLGRIQARTAPLTITVHGDPQPQGNKTAYLTSLIKVKPGPHIPKCPGCGTSLRGSISMTEARRPKSRAAFKAWRNAVINAAALARTGPAMTGPLGLALVVTVARPAGHYGTGRNAGLVKPAYANAQPHVRPDGGKYQRAVEDALTLAGIWGDDSQVVAWTGRKKYTGQPGALAEPGAQISVWHMPWDQL